MNIVISLLNNIDLAMMLTYCNVIIKGGKVQLYEYHHKLMTFRKKITIIRNLVNYHQ